jgi:methylaspartate ammonia-lyase
MKIVDVVCEPVRSGTDYLAELAAQAARAHVAMACGADQILAKPGMGVDEGLMIVGNEMVRVAELARRRAGLARTLCST